ncbi:Required for respiratory growth protein 9, mitochondrial [Cyphellophora attinorum]|uniref:Required for respiratory growth protein 9, mitochondrial n=1 Tax=Cyphellophora attinorum TaxID=1664694 RepID=A0A0N1H8R6_9EURO|nr:Required for respiratory growth protein 9, mitochondrial [Phialophora attinorum]KPI43550.1 Required for respiratory growth protein 9, mitochondrial [Phialophora attinorum]
MSSAAVARNPLVYSFLYAPFILTTPRSTSKKLSPSDHNNFAVKDAEIDAAAIQAARAELEALRLAESQHVRQKVPKQHTPEEVPEQHAAEEVPGLDAASESAPSESPIDVEKPLDAAYTPGRDSKVQEKWRLKWELTPEEQRRERGRQKKAAKKAAAIAADHEKFLQRQQAREARAALKEGSLRDMMTSKLDKTGKLRTLQSYDLNTADDDADPDTSNNRRPDWAKLSPDAMLGIKQLHASNPTMYTTPVLADQFKVSPEAIRRILKSKWLTQASPADVQRRREAWAKRHDAIWDQQSELGLRPKREKERRVRDASEGMDEFEEGVWRERVLEEARRA